LEENVAGATPSDLVRRGLGAPEILAHVLAGVPTTALEGHDVRFRCRCSRERALAAILAMGRDELLDVLAKERRADLVCEFCATRYVAEEKELRMLLA
jgi:molecular chaperone Hsp33